jgi:peroxiredoxin
MKATIYFSLILAAFIFCSCMQNGSNGGSEESQNPPRKELQDPQQKDKATGEADDPGQKGETDEAETSNTPAGDDAQAGNDSGGEEKSDDDPEADIRASTLISEGERVPAFRFTTTSGITYSMEGLRGKVVLLNLFATWCPVCMEEMPALQNQVWNKYKNRDDFMLVSIGREQDMQKMKDFKNKKGYGFHFAPDTARKIYGKFATKYIPRNVVVDKTGKIIYQGTGYDKEEFENMMQLIERELAD